jgi:hypothetical protein
MTCTAISLLAIECDVTQVLYVQSQRDDTLRRQRKRRFVIAVEVYVNVVVAVVGDEG